MQIPSSMILRRMFKTGLVAAVALCFIARSAEGGVDPVNKDNGVAMHGFDPVAYFVNGEPVKGNKKFAYEWMGAIWYFASMENKRLFEENPEKYSPQFGGYCAWAVSQNYTADGDPNAWKIVDGKLYVNYNKDVQKMWEQGHPGLITKGNRNWPRLIKK